MKRNAVIAATGSYAPEWILPNAYFNEQLGEDVDTWLRENLTIRERRWCREDESTADLCERAARQALKRADLPPEKLDLIIVATDTPEYISPSTASVVQHRLQAHRAATFDLNAACAGFVTAVDVAAKYIQADERYQYVLVIGGYAMSKYLNPADKKTVTLFADGAGCVLLEAKTTTGQGFLTSELYSEGHYHDWMGIYAGGTHQPVTPEVLRRGDQYLKFVRKFPRELNPRVWERMVRSMCVRAGIQVSDIDHFFFTQININSIWQTMDALGVPREKAPTIMDRYGYNGSACIPMVLDETLRSGRVQRGQKLALVGSGGGLAFAGALFVY